MNSSGAKKGNAYVHPATIEFYARQTWRFAKSILWNSLPLLPEEVELSLEYLKDYYRSIPPDLFVKVVTDYFKQFCERILLARRQSMNEKDCEHCGKGFALKRLDRKDCSDTCKQMACFERNGLSTSDKKPLPETRVQNSIIPHPCIWLNPLNSPDFSSVEIPALQKNTTTDAKPMTVVELARLFGISKPTMRKWLRPLARRIGNRVGNKYNTQQVEIILDALSSSH